MKALSAQALLLACSICIGLDRARSDPLVPASNDDLIKLAASVHAAAELAKENHCSVGDIRDRVKVALPYLQSMQSWLAPARADEVLQLKNLLSASVRESNRAAQLQFAISAQEALLEFSELMVNLTSMSKAVNEVAEFLEKNEGNGLSGAALAKKLAEYRDLHNEGLEATLTYGASLRAKLGELPSPDLAEWPDTLKQAVKQLSDDLPSEFSTLDGLTESGKKLKEYYSTAKDYIDVADLKSTLVKWLTLAAKWRQSKLLRELDALSADLAATDLAFARNYNEYRRLKERAELIDQIVDELSNMQYDGKNCNFPCEPKDAVPMPANWSSGAAPYDPAKKQDFAKYIRTFTPDVTGSYARLFDDVVRHWVDEARKDRSVLEINKRDGSDYDPGEPVTYNVHLGRACHGATLVFNFEKRRDLNESLSDSFVPDRPGRWDLMLDVHDGLPWWLHDLGADPRYIDRFRDFTVSIDKCIVGTWRSKSVKSLIVSGATGGDGILMTIGADGELTIDYTDMSPTKVVVAARPLQIEDFNSWSGVAKGKVQVQNKVVRFGSLTESDVIHIHRRFPDLKETTNRLGGFGPAFFDTSPYVCDENTLRYTAARNEFVFERHGRQANSAAASPAGAAPAHPEPAQGNAPGTATNPTSCGGNGWAACPGGR